MSSQPAPDPVYTLRGAGSPITYLTFHDGPGPQQDLYNGTQDGKIHIWDMEVRRIKASLDGHPGQAVLWIEFTPCGKMLTFGRDGILNVCQRADTDWIITDKVSTGAIGFSPAGLLLDEDNTGYIVLPSRQTSVCDVYRMETLTKLDELKPGAEKFGFVMCITSMKDNKTVLIGYENGSIALWDISKCKLLNSVKVFEESVLCVDYQSDLNKGFCGSVTNKITSFSVDGDEVVVGKSTETLNPGFNQIRIRGDKKIFVTAGWDHNVRVFSVKKLTPLAVLDYHKDSCQCLAFSTENLLACGSKDQQISLWKIY
ncbi:hypothetical protein FSP39_015278 [Pinctada imbricata]|uniref:Guanine nucleotide-binding protein subunit beta-like protein 1 n=1 Tax=Pinctada imbricata TaxID=66713 RepID=A0AA89BXH6_PINIB|nr:hypothetical protein FSP39_015278 [Pinctada imbricata]